MTIRRSWLDVANSKPAAPSSSTKKPPITGPEKRVQNARVRSLKAPSTISPGAKIQPEIKVPGPFPLTLKCATAHPLERMQERNISPKQVANALHYTPHMSYGNRLVFATSDTRVVVEFPSWELVTVTKNLPLFRRLDRIDGDHDCKNEEELKVYYKKVASSDQSMHRRGRAHFNLGVLYERYHAIRSIANPGFRSHYTAFTKEGHPGAIGSMLEILRTLVINSGNDSQETAFKCIKQLEKKVNSDIRKTTDIICPSDPGQINAALENYPLAPQQLKAKAHLEFLSYSKDDSSLTYLERLASLRSPFAAVLIITLNRMGLLKGYPNEKVEKLIEIIKEGNIIEFEEAFKLMLNSTNKLEYNKEAGLMSFGLENNSFSCFIYKSEPATKTKDHPLSLFYINLSKRSILSKEDNGHIDYYINKSNFHQISNQTCFLLPIQIKIIKNSKERNIPLHGLVGFMFKQFKFKGKILLKISEYYKKTGNIIDYEGIRREFKELEKASSNNNYDANMELGFLELSGINETGLESPQKAMEYFRKKILNNSHIKITNIQRAYLKYFVGFLYLDIDFFEPTKSNISNGVSFLREAGLTISAAAKYLKTCLEAHKLLEEFERTNQLPDRKDLKRDNPLRTLKPLGKYSTQTRS